MDGGGIVFISNEHPPISFVFVFKEKNFAG